MVGTLTVLDKDAGRIIVQQVPHPREDVGDLVPLRVESVLRVWRAEGLEQLLQIARCRDVVHRGLVVRRVLFDLYER